jgi:hypothetical protein
MVAPREVVGVVHKIRRSVVVVVSGAMGKMVEMADSIDINRMKVLEVWVLSDQLRQSPQEAQCTLAEVAVEEVVGLVEAPELSLALRGEVAAAEVARAILRILVHQLEPQGPRIPEEEVEVAPHVMVAPRMA